MELYHLRHAHRVGKNPHISKDGMLFAQEIGEKLPTFDIVLSSTSIRAIETTIAMGYPITDTINFDEAAPSSKAPENYQGFETYQEYAINIANTPYFSEFSKNLVKLLNQKLMTYKTAKKILLVSHGGVIECSTIGFLPSLDFVIWGDSTRHCTGVKLVFREGKCMSGEKFQ